MTSGCPRRYSRTIAADAKAEGAMSMYDLVIRNGTVATADAEEKCDIRVSGWRVAALPRDLGAGQRDTDPTGRIGIPAGVQRHCHTAHNRRALWTDKENQDVYISVAAGLTK